MLRIPTGIRRTLKQRAATSFREATARSFHTVFHHDAAARLERVGELG